MIQLTDKLWGVSVPLDAHSFEFYDKETLPFGIFYLVPDSVFPSLPKIQTIAVGNYKIVGTCSNDDIDFYTTIYGYTDAQFRSLLTSKNILFENPLKFPSTIDPEFYDEPYNGKGFYRELYGSAMSEWQAAQQNVIEKLLILEKI